jgi:hypothetical protein
LEVAAQLDREFQSGGRIRPLHCIPIVIKDQMETRPADREAGVPFSDLRQLLIRLGFEERIKGDHHICTKQGIEEILNLQTEGLNAKALSASKSER